MTHGRGENFDTTDERNSKETIKTYQWLSVRPFRVGGGSYDHSVAIDASTVDGVTVTVAVASSRSDELDILDTLYAAADGHDFYPFRDKSHDVSYRDSIELFETAVSANSHRLHATTHLGQDGSDPERVEAVQSAILVERLGVRESLVILDGDDDKATRFHRATAGISDEVPPTTTCVQSELYYPAALLADLCAYHLASQIDDRDHCSEVGPSAPIAKEAFSDLWGPAFNELVNSSESVSTGQIERRQAPSVPTRMNCWFNGWMGGGNERVQFDKSTTQITRYAEDQGYEELATRLSNV